MKQFLRNFIFFLGFTTITYFLLIFGSIFSPFKISRNINYRLGSNGHMNTRMKEVKETKNIDLLFLGSSHTYRGFDPRIFPLKTFNLGSSAQTPIQTQILLKRYLNQLNPKTIIYEVYPEPLSGDGVESSTDIISNDINDWYSFEMALKINHIKIYNTLLFGWFRDALSMNKNFSESNIKDLDTYIKGGYVERQITYFNPSKQKNHEPKKAEPIKDYQLKAFKENIQMIINRGINLILVQAPVPKQSYQTYNKHEYDSLMNSFQVPYYNFNELVQLDDSLHFYDDNHLNQNGVKLFNLKLLELLKK